MTSATASIHIAQLSDTHFLEDGESPEGGFAYDTDQAFAAVRDHLGEQPACDLVAVTGDVADHGRAAQYRKAADAFAQLTSPVNVCPGNHDQDMAFTVGMGRPTVGTSRSVEIGNWCFLFADSNAGVLVQDDDGRHVDPDNYGDRLHRNGTLGARERAWIRDMCDSTSADHVFVWIHHPPAPNEPLSFDQAYADEWKDLVPELPKLRGIGGGHTHVPGNYEFEGVPVFVCPAFKNNFDLQAGTMLPPGYRTYDFAADGSVTSQVQLVDDQQWPRRPVGRAVLSLLNGELSWPEFTAIVDRKRAERAAQ